MEILREGKTKFYFPEIDTEFNWASACSFGPFVGELNGLKCRSQIKIYLGNHWNYFYQDNFTINANIFGSSPILVETWVDGTGLVEKFYLI